MFGGVFGDDETTGDPDGPDDATERAAGDDDP